MLDDGLVQATSFATDWSEAMAAITAKHSELDQLSPVGVDIDTVKTQLEEYKVSKEGTGEWRDGMSMTYYVHSNRMQTP